MQAKPINKLLKMVSIACPNCIDVIEVEYQRLTREVITTIYQCYYCKIIFRVTSFYSVDIIKNQLKYKEAK